MDVLIRRVPEGDLRAIDEAAQRAGVSRSEYLRGELHRIARHRSVPPATEADYGRSITAMADIDNSDVMGSAWS